MPATDGLRLPIVERSVQEYQSLLRRCGFAYRCTDVFPSPAVLRAKPGLKRAGKVPIALLFECSLTGDKESDMAYR